jgi:hypothetical protein
MKKIKIIFCIEIVMLVSMSISCNSDQVTSKYPDYNSAKEGGLINQSWIPTKIVFNSMTDIYLKTNLDLNACIFSYKLQKSDFENITTLIQPTKEAFFAKNINPPNWWKEKVLTSEKYFILDETNDTTFITIDNIDKKIFGWRNPITTKR